MVVWLWRMISMVPWGTTTVFFAYFSNFATGVICNECYPHGYASFDAKEKGNNNNNNSTKKQNKTEQKQKHKHKHKQQTKVKNKTKHKQKTKNKKAQFRRFLAIFFENEYFVWKGVGENVLHLKSHRNKNCPILFKQC